VGKIVTSTLLRTDYLTKLVFSVSFPSFSTLFLTFPHKKPNLGAQK